MSIRKGDDVIAGASVGFIGKPAWSQAVSITTLTYTMPADGLLVGVWWEASASNTGNELKINGIKVSQNKANDSQRLGLVQVPVKSGDVMTLTGSTTPQLTLSFVPFEYSGVSDINVITPEYIRNQNILDPIPDTTFNFNAPAPYDGFVCVHNGNSGGGESVINILRNGDTQQRIFTNEVSGGSSGNTTIAPICKGDTLYKITPSYGSSNANIQYALWYKLRDYTGR